MEKLNINKGIKKLSSIILLLVFALVLGSCLIINGGNEEIELSEEDKLLQEEKLASVRFFLEAVNLDEDSPGYGLIRDRYPSAPDMASIASVGFGLALLPVAVKEGLIEEEEAEKRAIGTLKTFQGLDEAVGFFYHFLDMETGERYRDVEYSTIDTALFIGGAIIAAEYFGGETYTLMQELYEQIDWDYFVNKETNQFHMAMKPLQGFQAAWDYYAEQLIMYVLGAGSPTHPIDPIVYYRFTRNRDSYKGEEFINSWHGAIFTYQYSHAFVDFRGIEDELGQRWFENSIHGSLASYQYSQDLADQYQTFAEGAWGLTASDTPDGYSGLQGSPPSGAGNTMHSTDGTISTSGALASIVFTPEQSKEAMKLYSEIPEIQGEFGLNNAYNRDRNWYGHDTIGIDKGITAMMIENYQSGMLWGLFMQNEYVKNGIDLLGFTEYDFEAANAEE